MATSRTARLQVRGNPFDLVSAATVVLDRRGTVIGWNQAAADAYGFSAHDVLGRPSDDLIGRVDNASSQRPVFLSGDAQPGWAGKRMLRRRDGGTVSTVLHVCPLEAPDTEIAWLVILIPEDRLQQWGTDQAMLNGLFTQSPIQLTVFGVDGRVRWVNAAVAEQFGSPEESVGSYVKDLLPQGETLSPEQGVPLDEVISQVLRTGEPVFDVHYRSPTGPDPAHHHVWSCSYFRLQDAGSRPLGVCEAAFEITDRYVAWQRLALLGRASSIGRTLDVRRTAEELAAVVVPDFADAIRIDLAEHVLVGGEESAGHAGGQRALHRVVDRKSDGSAGIHLCRATATEGELELVLPLQVGDVYLGEVTFARLAPRDPFCDEDRGLAAELVSRTAVCIDNARRFVREHTRALLLQRNLLPDKLPEPTGVEVAHHYAPAAGPVGVGGDWYDVIPLSGARVALVVGDVVGHGLDAAATMGRLRTTVRALAVLDLDPGELLARLDDLVGQAHLGIHSTGGELREDPGIGARCLYVVYDPCSGQCSVASAGHLPPVVARPDGEAGLLDMAVGPPLGIGGLPFETTEINLPADSLMALFTDGLVQHLGGDADSGVEALCRVLRRPGMSPGEACSSIAATCSADPAQDDEALLLVRVKTLAEHNMASWPINPAPQEVAEARSLAAKQLKKWGLEEVSFVVELVVSELTTNAIRYGGAPVYLRLLRDQDRMLICEVSDGGHTSPHLRRAGMDEEGGRGLFLVAQFTGRWGTRYTREGKTMWAELPLGELGAEREIPLFG